MHNEVHTHYSGWRVRIGIAISILLSVVVLYLISQCFHFMNQPNTVQLMVGLIGLIILVIIILPVVLRWLWKFTFKTKPEEASNE